MKIEIDGIEVLVEDADQYLQINDICETDLKRVWQKINADYKKYDKWFCYHNTKVPCSALHDLGAVLVDNNIELRLNACELNCSDTLKVEPLEYKDFDEFSSYHDKRNAEIYWTSERIKRDLTRWSIFVLKYYNQISGYILLSMWNAAYSEIYCIDACDDYQCEALITFAAKHTFDTGRKEVLFMVDENTISQKAALAVGFIATGFYKGYSIKRMS